MIANGMNRVMQVDTTWMPMATLHNELSKLFACGEVRLQTGTSSRVRYRVSLFAALGLSLACRATAGAPQARHEPCPPATSDTAGWQTVAFGPFTTILPAAFRPDSTFRCFHGGEFWVDGPRAFGYCWGTFGRVAPTGAPGEEIMSVAGHPAVVACSLYRGLWTVMAYHVGDSTTFGVHGESPSRAGLAPFMRALRSARPRTR